MSRQQQTVLVLMLLVLGISVSLAVRTHVRGAAAAELVARTQALRVSAKDEQVQERLARARADASERRLARLVAAIATSERELAAAEARSRRVGEQVGRVSGATVVVAYEQPRDSR